MTIDDARIQKLRAEVLGQLDASRPAEEASGLEARVAALETAVAALAGQRPGEALSAPVAAGRHVSHPSLQVLGPGGAPGDRCLMEPEKPCVQSHACRVYGH